MRSGFDLLAPPRQTSGGWLGFVPAMLFVEPIDVHIVVQVTPLSVSTFALR